MKTPEDEAFDDLARRQGDWGSGFQIKPRKAADKLFEDQINYGTSWSKNGERIDPASVYLEEPAHCQCIACKDGIIHASDCAVHNGPAYPAGSCDCGVAQEPVAWQWLGSAQFRKKIPKGADKTAWSPLYTTPPKREWVGLTEKEIAQGNKESWVAEQAWQSAVWWAEAKLKDKNG